MRNHSQGLGSEVYREFLGVLLVYPAGGMGNEVIQQHSDAEQKGKLTKDWVRGVFSELLRWGQCIIVLHVEEMSCVSLLGNG